MKLHRFYVGTMKLQDKLLIDDLHLLHQWNRVLRFEPGREVELFNDEQRTKRYKIMSLNKQNAKLEFLQDRDSKTPMRELYLCFSLLKKDKNEWVLQKATELGVGHFMPLVSDRTEKTGWDSERAEKIVIEAAEQCGRSDIPMLYEPTAVKNVLERLKGKAEVFIAEESAHIGHHTVEHMPMAILIGPEGGWSDEEKDFFKSHEVKHMKLGDFTLRAETAAIVAAALLQ